MLHSELERLAKQLRVAWNLPHWQRSRATESAAKELRILAAQAAALEADKVRLDWLETQQCWIGLHGEFEMKARFYAGKGYRMTVREAADQNITLGERHDG